MSETFTSETSTSETSTPETFTLTVDQAQAYEDVFVPALFAQWVPILLRTAGVARAHRVLDVGCGTGVAARGALELVGPSGSVSGVDLNPAMISVAQERVPAIDWRVADAGELPYGGGSFDVVLCQSALFFFPEPARAVREMARVTAPGGVVALQTYAGLAEQPAYGPFVRIVVGHAGDEAQRLLGTYWSQGDPSALRRLLEDASLTPAEVRDELGKARFPTLDAFLHSEIQGTPLAGRIDERTYRAIAQEVRTVLGRYERADGSVALPIRACFVAGRKAVS